MRKQDLGGTLGLEETQGDERRIVPRPTQPKVRGGALAPAFDHAFENKC